MAVSFSDANQLNSPLAQLRGIGQRGAYTPEMKLPDPKPRTPLQPFSGLGVGSSANQGVTAGTTPVAPDLARLLSAIKGQESGGRYSAYNRGSGASGAYQILRSNFEKSGSGWDMDALGRDVSFNEFISSPAIQDAIARHRLGQLLKSRGMAGAAATWYGGDWGYNHMYDMRPQNGYPSMYDYVMSILNRAR